jgi:hypothetical protein
LKIYRLEGPNCPPTIYEKCFPTVRREMVFVLLPPWAIRG